MNPQSRQKGMALVVGLIILVIMTFVAVVSFKMARTSLEIVGNMQVTNAAVASANAAIEEALSTTRLFQAPQAVFLVPCAGPNTRCYDINSDGANDVTVTLAPAPTCRRWQNVRNAVLDLSDQEDFNCTTGAPLQYGIDGVPTGNSLCADSLWEIQAVAADMVTSTTTTVVEGAAVRVAQDDVLTTCPNPD